MFVMVMHKISGYIYNRSHYIRDDVCTAPLRDLVTGRYVNECINLLERCFLHFILRFSYPLTVQDDGSNKDQCMFNNSEW